MGQKKKEILDLIGKTIFSEEEERLLAHATSTPLFTSVPIPRINAHTQRGLMIYF